MESLIHTIYAAIDPRDGKVKYVGMTITEPRMRFNALCSKKNKSPVSQWVQSLRQANIRPRFVILEQITCVDLSTFCKEGQWIDWFRKQGQPLLNKNRAWSYRVARNKRNLLLDPDPLHAEG